MNIGLRRQLIIECALNASSRIVVYRIIIVSLNFWWIRQSASGSMKNRVWAVNWVVNGCKEQIGSLARHWCMFDSVERERAAYVQSCAIIR